MRDRGVILVCTYIFSLDGCKPTSNQQQTHQTRFARMRERSFAVLTVIFSLNPFSSPQILLRKKRILQNRGLGSSEGSESMFVRAIKSYNERMMILLVLISAPIEFGPEIDWRFY